MSSGLLTRGPAVDRAPVDMDPRVRARRVEVARDQGRRRRRRLVLLLAVVILIAAAVGLTQSPALDVDHIAVQGGARTGAPAVRAAAGIELGRPVISVDEAAAQARLEALPWVAEARVASHWPGTVRIEVTERVPVAVAGSGSAAALVDASGQVLGAAPADVELPTVVTASVPAPGRRLSDRSRAAVSVVAALPEDLASQVSEIERQRRSILVTLDDGIEVDLGDATRLRAKSDAVLALLGQADRSTIATIDVSVPGTAALTRSEAEGA